MSEMYFDFQTLESESIEKQYSIAFREKHKDCPGFWEDDSYCGHIMVCDDCDDHLLLN